MYELKIRRFKNRIGLRYGRLTVVRYFSRHSNGKHVLWECRCDCGAIHIAGSQDLQGAKVKSCGCLQREASRKAGLKNMLPYQKASKNRLLYKYKIGAAKRGHAFELTDQEFFRLVFSRCFYCGSLPLSITRSGRIKESEAQIVHNGIDRIRNRVGYVLQNCVPCCSRCNFAKHGLSAPDFLDHIKKIYEYLRLGETNETLESMVSAD